MRERSLSIAWLTSPIHRRSEDESSPILKGKQPVTLEPIISRRMRSDLGFHLDLPPPEPVITTISHNKTPGWDSPWSPRPPADLVARITGNAHTSSRLRETNTDDGETEKLNSWARRRKRYRAYILNNTYVPLVCVIFPSLHFRFRSPCTRRCFVSSISLSPLLRLPWLSRFEIWR